MGIQVCENCGEDFAPKKGSRVGRFCSLRCYHAAGRPKRRADVAYRMTRAPDHPVAPASGTVAVCRIVLYDSIGPGAHPCHWCGCEVRWMAGGGLARGALLVDHLNFDPADDRIENLVPACQPCNAHRRKTGGAALIKADEVFRVFPNGTRTRALRRYCVICATPFLAVPAEAKIPGRAIYCSLSCARRAPRRARRSRVR